MVADPVDLRGRKVLITGVTGQVAKPMVAAYAKVATVYAAARYTNEDNMQAMEALGAKALKIDLVDAKSLEAIPEDIDYVIHCAVVKSGDWVTDLAGNGEGIGNLISRCRRAKAIVHFSTTGVYAYEGHAPRQELANLGDNHKSLLPTYSISKIAAETVARFAAHQFGVKLTIARLNVPYGDFGCWPYMHLMQMQAGMPITVHPERPNYYSPIHSDDYIEKVPRLLAVATPEVTLTNLGGSQAVSIEEWSAYLGEITGLTPTFADNPAAFGSLQCDMTRMHSLIGETKVDWRQGMKRMVKALAPELLKA